MILNREDAIYCANVFNNYFGKITNIEEYMRDEKLKNISSLPTSLFPPEDDNFLTYDLDEGKYFGSLPHCFVV